MKKNLPKLFKGKVVNNVNQIKTILSNNEVKEEYKKEELVETKSVKKQINEILNSSDFVYKADVKITLFNNEELEKTIIGRTNNSLITMDDELIDVSKISKIELL